MDKLCKILSKRLSKKEEEESIEEYFDKLEERLKSIETKLCILTKWQENINPYAFQWIEKQIKKEFTPLRKKLIRMITSEKATYTSKYYMTCGDEIYEYKDGTCLIKGWDADYGTYYESKVKGYKYIPKEISEEMYKLAESFNKVNEEINGD